MRHMGMSVPDVREKVEVSKISTIINDQYAIKRASQVIEELGYDYYEIISIIPLGKEMTSVIVDVGSVNVSIEVDTKSGRILFCEKIPK